MKYVNLSKRTKVGWWIENYPHCLVVKGYSCVELMEYNTKVFTPEMAGASYAIGSYGDLPDLLYKHDYNYKKKKACFRIYFKTKDDAIIFKLAWS